MGVCKRLHDALNTALLRTWCAAPFLAQLAQLAQGLKVEQVEQVDEQVEKVACPSRTCDTFIFGASNTIDTAGNLPDSEVFSRPESFGFGRDGLVRKAGRMAVSMFETSRPPVARSNAASGLQSHTGAETMSKVYHLASRSAAPILPTTGTSHDPIQLHAEAHNALAMALHYLRQPASNVPGAARKAVQALAALNRLGGAHVCTVTNGRG